MSGNADDMNLDEENPAEQLVLDQVMDPESDDEDVEDNSGGGLESQAYASSSGNGVPPTPSSAAGSAYRGGIGFLKRVSNLINKGEKEANEKKESPPKEARTMTPPAAFLVRETVNDAEAVNLEKICQAITGAALVIRLEIVFENCPPLSKEAFSLLVDYLKKNTSNTTKYQSIYTRMEQLAARPADYPPFDKEWFERTSKEANLKLENLQVELKKQKDEGVRESTRRATEELFNQHMAMGQLVEAVRLLSRGMREHCNQLKHIVQMWTSWMEVELNLQEWHNMDTLVTQTERAVREFEDGDRIDKSENRVTGLRLAPAPNNTFSAQSAANKAILFDVKAKLDVVAALNHMHNKRYSEAADRFLKVDADQLESPWVVGVSDLAKYGVLCAIATLQRAELKGKCLDSSFRKILENEPKMIDFVTAFSRSRFGKCFEILDNIKNGLLLDPFFYDHVGPIYSIIRRRALVQYLKPFATADLRTMATVFRTDVDSLEAELIPLMDAGEIVDKRIDDREKMMETTEREQRQVTMENVIRTCDALIKRTEQTLGRTLIAQGKLYLDPAENTKTRGGKKRTNEEGSESTLSRFSRNANTFLRSIRNTAPDSSLEPVEPE